MGGTFTSYLASSCVFHSPLYASAWAVSAGFYDYHAGKELEECLIRLAALAGRPELPQQPYDEADESPVR